MATGGQNNPVKTIAIANYKSLSELLAQLNSNIAIEIVDTIPFDKDSQIVVIQLAQLVETETKIKLQETEGETRETGPGVSQALQRFRHVYSASGSNGFSDDYNEWRVAREKLIENLTSGAESLDFYFKWASFCRLTGSFVSFFGTFGKTFSDAIVSDWAKYAIAASSSVGFMSLAATVVEAAVSKGIFEVISEAITKDQDKFKPIEKWFKQWEDLDAIVRDFFPYGIDRDIVRKIEEESIHLEYDLKIFEAILATNVKKRPRLMQDKNFLAKGIHFSKDPAAQQWWKRVILMPRPIDFEYARLFVDNLLLLGQTIGSQLMPALPLETTRLINLGYQAKIVLNSLIMYDALRSLCRNAGSKTILFRDLKSKAAAELEAMNVVVHSLGLI